MPVIFAKHFKTHSQKKKKNSSYAAFATITLGVPMNCFWYNLHVIQFFRKNTFV